MSLWDKLRALLGRGDSDKTRWKPGGGAADDATDRPPGAAGSVDRGDGDGGGGGE